MSTEVLKKYYSNVAWFQVGFKSCPTGDNSSPSNDLVFEWGIVASHEDGGSVTGTVFYSMPHYFQEVRK